MKVTALACLVALGAASGSSTHQIPSRVGVIAYRYQGPVTAFSLWAITSDGSSARQKLRLGPESSFDPHWSSDGMRLLFTRATGTYLAWQVGDGGIFPIFESPKRVAPYPVDYGLDWSPDGTSIVFTRDVPHRCSELFTMRSDGSRLRRLTISSECEKHPAWSPDGSVIAFEKEGDQDTEIVVSNVRGANARTIGLGTYPAWSPEADSLAFLGQDAIVLVDAHTGAVRRTIRPETPWDEVENGLAWAPDGSRLAFGFHDEGETFPLTHLALVESDGTDPRFLTTETTFADTDPDWRPLCDVYGTASPEALLGAAGGDIICALRGNDRIRADGGDDVVYGGDGADVLVGGPGADWLFGAAGDDRIYARDGVADLVDGGPGVDRAVVDAADRVSGVERVDRG
jgi:dipeptidyl aminopeptidase/acylaminoacyl peptidase